MLLVLTTCHTAYCPCTKHTCHVNQFFHILGVRGKRTDCKTAGGLRDSVLQFILSFVSMTCSTDMKEARGHPARCNSSCQTLEWSPESGKTRTWQRNGLNTCLRG